jgi:broad specificity phosphatase PhoE
MFALIPEQLPLTELGYQQARAVAERIRTLYRASQVVTSPYLRARETARVIAEALALPFAVEPLLHERNFGAFRGRPYDSMRSEPDYDPQRPWIWKPRDGESYDEVTARVRPIIDRLAAANPTADVVVVSHGAVMLALWALLSGSWDAAHAPPNCGVVVVEHGPRGFSRPVAVGETRPASETGG